MPLALDGQSHVGGIAEMEQSADLGVLDILCLHSVNHRGRAKKLADICFKLNVEDSQRSITRKKLVKYGLVQSEKQGKRCFMAPAAGLALCMAYRRYTRLSGDEYAALWRQWQAKCGKFSESRGSLDYYPAL